MRGGLQEVVEAVGAVAELLRSAKAESARGWRKATTTVNDNTHRSHSNEYRFHGTFEYSLHAKLHGFLARNDANCFLQSLSLLLQGNLVPY